MTDPRPHESAEPPAVAGGPERCLLVCVVTPQTRSAGWEAQESLAELALLVHTAGGTVAGTLTQQRSKPDVATAIGEGKAAEVESRRQTAADFDAVVFDMELTPTQQRNLEGVIGCPVLDRTAIILDIFARRARSREAMLQVELAQLQYRLPRLAGRGTALSRLGGGIGTRGPGETKLEVDRRRIRQRIAQLRQELDAIGMHRARLRQERTSRSAAVVALTGYTNAGKSTLHRALAHSDVLAEDLLFATLDATARRVEPTDGEPYILVDTVGFIHNLPHHLVAAFRSTLEEVVAADLIVHVVDASHPKVEEQMQVVADVLGSLGAEHRPMLVALNKIDQVDSPGHIDRLRQRYPGAVALAAATGQGLNELGRAIQQHLATRRQVIEVLVPYDHAGIVALVHAQGRVLVEEHREEGTYLRAELERGQAARILARLASTAEVPPSA